MKIWFLLLLIAFSIGAYAQRVEGKIIDGVSGETLPFGTIRIKNKEKKIVLESASDRYGLYNINLSSGFYYLHVSYLGYESFLDSLVITESKIYTKDITLQPAEIQFASPVIRANMVEQTGSIPINKNNFLKLSGSFNDPSRLLIKYPSITATNDQNNAITLKGMPPGMASWFVNGASIVNPNHLNNAGTFTDQSSANGGGVNMISGNSVGAFEFIPTPLTGDYFNVGSGAMDFDLDIESGGSFSLGLLGTEFRYGYATETLRAGINYRYSTLGILSALGVPLGDEVINFQDVHARVEKRINTVRLGLDIIAGTNSNIHESLGEESVFFKDALFIGLRANQQVASFTCNVLEKNWTLHNTINFSRRASQREVRADQSIVPFIIDSLEHVQENRLSMSNRFSYYMNNQLSVSINNISEMGNLNYRGRNANYRRGMGLFQINKSLGQWKIEGAIGLSFFSHKNEIQETRSSRLGSEQRFLISYVRNKNRWNGQVSRGLVTVLPEFMVIGTNIVPMNTIHLSSHYVRDGNWGKMKIGGFHHRFQRVIVSEEGRVSYFNRFDLIENEVLSGQYSSDGSAHITGALLEYQKDIHSFQVVANSSFYDLKIAERIEGDYNFNYTYSLNASHAQKIKNNILLLSASIIGRGANREFDIDEQQSSINQTTVYNREIRRALNPYSRVDFKATYTWGNPSSRLEYLVSLDIQNVLNKRNDSFSFYDPLAEEVFVAQQLGLIPVLTFQVSF